MLRFVKRYLKKFLNNFKEADKQESEKYKTIRLINRVVDTFTNKPNIIFKIKNISNHDYHVIPMDNVVGAFMHFDYDYKELEKIRVSLVHYYGISSVIRRANILGAELETENLFLTVRDVNESNSLLIKDILASLENDILEAKEKEERAYNSFIGLYSND